MKIIYKNILVLILMLSLSACPYKEVYKPLTRAYAIDRLKVNPVQVFRELHKGIGTYGIILNFNNQSDSILKVNFSNSHLINSKNTVILESVYAWGVPLNADYTFNLFPKIDTTLEFKFKDLEKNFGDTIKVVLKVSGVGENTFVYKKVN